MKPNIIERARGYLGRMPVSVSGQGGHTAAFNAALALVKGFNLPESETMPLLSEWNAQCLPPWSEADLRHKLKSASAASDKPNGYLVAGDDQPRDRVTPDHETESERKARLRAYPAKDSSE
jgi:hypothetical protein